MLHIEYNDFGDVKIYTWMNELYGSGDSGSGYEYPLNWNEHKKMKISRPYLDIKTATVIILMLWNGTTM